MMLTDSLVSLVTEYCHHANVTHHLASLSPLALSRHAREWWWSEGSVGLLDQDSPWTLLLYLAGVVVLLLAYRAAFIPVDVVKDMTEVGWGCLGGGRKATLTERIREVQRLRKKGNLPPVYPNGWFAVLQSRELPTGKVESVQVLGQTLAVFRGEDGLAHVTDAYCPHIGANMAVGGVVKGDCLECPFHGWRFRGSDGKCVEIPYSSKAIPRSANVRRWASREVSGFIFVWHDAEGREPLWELPEVTQVEDGSWAYRGRTIHQILAHIQEIPENGADVAHLGHLHVPIFLKGTDLRDIAKNSLLDFAKHTWTGEWQARASPESHVADLTVNHCFSFFGGRLNLFHMTVKVEQLGPGVVYLYFNTILGSGVLVQTVTPLEPLRQKVVHHFFSSWGFIAPLAKSVILSEAKHFERDIMVWNNKQYLSQPLLVAEDRFIVKFRRWYSQFYSENSPKFSFTKESLDW